MANSRAIDSIRACSKDTCRFCAASTSTSSNPFNAVGSIDASTADSAGPGGISSNPTGNLSNMRSTLRRPYDKNQ